MPPGLCVGGLLLVSSLLLIPTTSRAAGDTRSPMLLKLAEEHFLAGISLARMGKYHEAIARLRASLRLVPGDTLRQRRIKLSLRYYIGRTYHLMGKHLLARDNYRAFLASAPAKNRKRGQVGRWLAEILPRLGGTVSVRVVGPPARVVVAHPGGRRSGESPLTVKVEAGEVTVTVRRPGFLPHSTILAVRPRQTLVRTVSLARQRVTPPAQSGRRVVHHKVRWLAWVLAGAGTAGLGAGVAFGRLSQVSQGVAVEQLDLKTAEGTQDAIYFRTEAVSRARIANILYATGGALLAAGVVTFFLTPSRLIAGPTAGKASSGVSVVPVPLLGGAGLSARGSF